MESFYSAVYVGQVILTEKSAFLRANSNKVVNEWIIAYLSNRPQVSMVYRLINTRGIGRTREEYVNVNLCSLRSNSS